VEVLSISRRSLSPVTKKSALAAKQHSKIMLSSGSRQITSLFLGTAILACATYLSPTFFVCPAPYFLDGLFDVFNRQSRLSE